MASRQGSRTGRAGQNEGQFRLGPRRWATFYASTIDHRAKRAWKQANARAVAAAERDGGEAELLRPITLHECRHAFASLLIDAGANPKAIQQFMGRRPSTSTGICCRGVMTRSVSEWTYISAAVSSPAARPFLQRFLRERQRSQAP